MYNKLVEYNLVVKTWLFCVINSYIFNVNNWPKLLLCTVGLQREYQVECCGCKSEACTLIELGLWSATPIKPTMAFTFSLMEQLEKKFLIGKLSVKQFCASLPDFSNFPVSHYLYTMCQSIVHNYSF